MPSWKVVKSRKQKIKKTKLALVVLGLVILLIIFAYLVRLSNTLFSPWNLTSERSYTWNGQFNINLVIKGKEISLVSFNPKEQKVTVIKVPDQTFLDVPQGFGKWQLRSIYDLGQSQLLQITLTDFFGLPIDGFIETKENLFNKNPFFILNLKDLKTDLTPWEFIRLRINLSQVRFDKISELDLINSGVLDQTILPDGSQVFSFDPVKIDSILSDLADPTFVSEGKTIAIFNATDHSALAQKAARLVSNLGGHVIITASANARLKASVVVGEQSATLKRLRQIFGDSGTIDGLSEDLVSSRAQINIFLGEDYFQTN